nr:cellulose synthase A catalytic subunit 5 [UDP-forming]-like [Tanacetum cinerariifolium]
SPRVDGDEEEDGYDDLDNEFDLGNHGTRENVLSLSVAMLSSRMSDDSSHALIVPPYMDRARRVHPMQPFDTASSVSLPPRPMDPKRDLAVYGYG